MRVSFRATVLFALGAALGPRWASAQTCTAITSLPFSISSSGHYCLSSDLVYTGTTGYAIVIGADSVVLDLKGRMIDGSAPGTGTENRGIMISGDRKYVTVKNGTVRGFREGVYNSSSAGRGILIEDMRLQNNTTKGIVAGGIGLIVRNNKILSTGGCTEWGCSPAGILALGSGIRILNNEIIDTVAGWNSPKGIDVAQTSGAVVEGNRISHLTNSGFGILLRSGTTNTTNALVVGNRITNTAYGIVYEASNTGKYRDNLTSGCTTPYSGGTDAGDNY